MSKYTVYKTTNLINGKFYIGTHKTKDPNDSYLGSGTLLKRAIAKYGVEAFKKEVLFVFDNPEAMFAKEAEIVTAEFLAENNTYNLKLGGFGGFDWINSNITNEQKIARSQAAYQASKLWMFRKPKRDKPPKILGSRYIGTRWIHNNEKCVRIPRHQTLPSGWVEGRVEKRERRAKKPRPHKYTKDQILLAFAEVGANISAIATCLGVRDVHTNSHVRRKIKDTIGPMM